MLLLDYQYSVQTQFEMLRKISFGDNTDGCHCERDTPGFTKLIARIRACRSRGISSSARLFSLTIGLYNRWQNKPGEKHLLHAS